MVKVAFCDDDHSSLNHLQVLLDRYRLRSGREIAHTAFRSPLDLLAEIERGTRYDVLFMDVLMPGENGIDAAAEIRHHDRDIKIIFLTSSAEYAVQSYTVGAYFYQLKPIDEEKFFRLMDAVLAVCQKERASSLILRCKTGITRIDPQHLEFCEVRHRTLLIHLDGGEILESSGSLDELSKHLMLYGCFLRPHRSYLVNLDYVQNLSYRGISMACGAEIPIPRGKYHEIKDAFLEYAFQNGQVTL